MKQVDIFITASIRGPARGTGRVMYIMRTKRNNGSDYESRPSVAESDNATEGRLVLMALRDAMQRMNYACRVTVHTENAYIAGAISRHWMETWERNGWKNARKEEVRDSILWSRIYQILAETGHELSARQGVHEFTHWMRFQMQTADAHKDIFSEVREKQVCFVHD